METFLLIIGILFIYGIFSHFYDRYKVKEEWERFRKESDAEHRAMIELVAQEKAEIASRPGPYIGMDEEYVYDTNWGEYFTCLETVSINAIERKYCKENRGYLLFSNGKLIEIQEYL